MICAVAEAPLSLGPDEVDLGSWALGLTDEDYRLASRAHLALGRRADAVEGLLAIECFGPLTVVDRHEPELVSAHRFWSTSLGSRAHLTRSVGVSLALARNMTYRPTGSAAELAHFVRDLEQKAALSRPAAHA